MTFQDSTLWCAREDLEADVVYQALKTVYSPEGLEHMVKSHNAAVEMTVENGIKGIPLPMHKGAETFWTEKGLQIPDAIKAK